MQNIKIGFIGQGWIGKHYADDFEKRGYTAIRYGLEEPHINNKEKIKDCDIVFIAVPTPSTPQGFDYSIVEKAIKLVGDGKVALIKSTILPKTTEIIQEKFTSKFIMHSPEFLTEATAAYDAAHPNRNIIGIPINNDEYKEKAKMVLKVLPKAPYELICQAREAELIKYGGNCWFYFKVIFINMLYDLASELDCDWKNIRNAMAADPRIGSSHMNPVHDSGTKGGGAGRKPHFNELHLEPAHKSGRGAGGHCFIKDMAAFCEMYEKYIDDEHGLEVLKSIINKNMKLLVDSEKDLDLLAGVYGEDVVNKFKDK